jgi:hypothetical protein
MPRAVDIQGLLAPQRKAVPDVVEEDRVVTELVRDLGLREQRLPAACLDPLQRRVDVIDFEMEDRPARSRSSLLRDTKAC